MSTPQDHHFVPQVYLKEFANSQKQLFQAVKGKTNIAIKSIGQICYKSNYFRINSVEGLGLFKIEDQNFIEKNVFKKQENLYTRLLRRMIFPTASSLALSKSDVLFFIELLVTIKRRNPSYRQRIIEGYKNHISSEQFQREAEKAIEISKKIDGDKIDPVEYFKNFVEDALTNPNRQSDMYLQTFLDAENKSAENTAQILNQYKIFIYQAPFGALFLTSDNPGFTIINDDELLSFGGFALPFKFMFPITPKHCVFIEKQNVDQNSLLLTKDVFAIQVDHSMVDAINACTYRTANEKVFSYSKDILSKISRQENYMTSVPRS